MKTFLRRPSQCLYWRCFSSCFHLVGQPTPLELDPPAQSPVSYDLYPGLWYTLDAYYSSSCWGDFAPVDGDVDGSDLSQFAESFDDTYLQRFSTEFGKADCIQ